ncbi:LptA/OstA family protein [Hoeflea sp.]|uniref:LptA/OstA family protein n=1 Tax=Hoeflea sp. TaxID=1940281 RepID=UPI003B025B00
MRSTILSGLHHTLLAGALFAVLAVPGLAQGTTDSRLEGLALSGDQPIQIESDQLKVEDEKGTATFTGNVKVVQGQTMMQSGHMTVHYAKDGGSPTTGTSQIDRIDVGGKIYIRSENQEATADRGVFNMKTEIVELTGERVVLSEGNNVFVGCKLTVFMKTGEAKLESCGNRVRIQLDPKSRQQN